MAERSWLEHVATELAVDADIPEDALLDAARVVAHSVERKATPLTTYLIGLAAASEGADAATLSRRVIELARAWDGENADADGPGG